MKNRTFVNCSLAAVAMLSLTGCGKDTADAIDNAKSAVVEAIDNAPTGSEIVDGFNEAFEKGRENNSGIISGIFG